LSRQALRLKASQVDVRLSGPGPKCFCCMTIFEMGTFNRVAGIGHISARPAAGKDRQTKQKRQPKGVLGHPPSL